MDAKSLVRIISTWYEDEEELLGEGVVEPKVVFDPKGAFDTRKQRVWGRQERELKAWPLCIRMLKLMAKVVSLWVSGYAVVLSFLRSLVGVNVLPRLSTHIAHRAQPYPFNVDRASALPSSQPAAGMQHLTTANCLARVGIRVALRLVNLTCNRQSSANLPPPV